MAIKLYTLNLKMKREAFIRTPQKLSLQIFIFLILIIPVKNVYGQDVGIGLKAGLDFNTQLHNFQFVTGELELDLDPLFTTGYNLGLIYRKRLSPNLRIHAEPTIISTGARYKESFIFRGFEFEVDSESKLSYLQLPLLLGLTTTPPDLQEFPKPWEETTYQAIIGIYGSYLLDARFSGTNSGSPIGVDFEEEFSEDVTSSFNSYDFGFLVGGGFEHGYLNKMGMETRIYLGLIDTTNPNQVELKPNNLTISILLYYIF